ncbi:hypothetical protein [Amycolatopsis rubida]|uniref:Uncharacterized protein n=1 Tax=Amycolatopsis rubida TaxID=112413 RepID=A0A1I5XAE8_9PSEU|nr:hypothetical protein [Amycolatopsis rubida]SFQ28953.1 hypothetical protein SAMN05421854_110124 [Amycolatopsis rubida]
MIVYLAGVVTGIAITLGTLALVLWLYTRRDNRPPPDWDPDATVEIPRIPPNPG